MTASVEDVQAPLPDSMRPAVQDPRLDFPDQALSFAARHSREWPFRFLRLFTRAEESGLTAVMAKIYCDSLPECPGEQEPLVVSLLKLLLHPFYFLVSKKFLWRTEKPVEFDLEIVDRPFFNRWYRSIYERLPEPKRISPCQPDALPELPQAEPLYTTVTLRGLFLLFTAPLWALPLWRLSRRYGQNLMASYRRALSIYATCDGHFRRYPCRHFVTYADELNHPSRYLAFHQSCPGQMVAVQNGERLYHPAFAFGMLDAYLTFGPYMHRLSRDLRMDVGRIVPVGALNLQEWYPLLAGLENSAPPIRYDVLLLDQCIWPYNGLDRKTAAAFERLFANLNTYKTRHPDSRIAFQLRDYGPHAERREHILKIVRRHFTAAIDILDNIGRGESYTNIAQSRLMLCFNSTIGYEAFFCGRGKKTLFVNYTGDPTQILSLDSRFQLYDQAADYGRFEQAVTALLQLELGERPEVAAERHLPPDGKVPDRIAEFLIRQL